MWVLVILAPFALGGRLLAEPASIAPTKLDAVEKIFALSAANAPEGSMTFGVVSGKDLVLTRSYGLADMRAHTPASADTVYRIGSITKQFTGVMLLQLEERGKLTLSDPVEKYLPAVKALRGWPPQRSITLLDLATHRAGLAREPVGCIDPALHEECSQVGPVSHWEQTLESALPRVTLESAPETRFSYSNVGYAILGAALEQPAGMPYTDYVAQNIFVPLGMTNTAFEAGPQMLTHLAKGYIVAKRGVVDESLATAELKKGRGYKVPNGAIFTTVGDMARFVSFEMGFGPPEVLKREALQANFARAFPAFNGSGEYGVGFMKEGAGHRVLIGHSGSVAGYSASAFFNPEEQVGVICLRNSSIPCDNLVEAALNTLLGR